MRQFSSKILYFLVLVGLITSCKKALDIDPTQSIDSNTALSSRDNINAAITGIYSRLKSARLYGRDLIAIPDALADNGFATNKSGRLNPEANNTSGAHFTATVWSGGYTAINEINNVLAAIGSVSDATAADRTSWEGQLYFLRGLYHFDIVRVFAYIPGAVVAAQDRGGIPILLTPVKDIEAARNFLPGRSPIDSVYDQIVSDLVLSNSRYTVASFTTTTDPSLVNKAAIQSLLVRVNLYRKNYTEAKRWADSVTTFVQPLSGQGTGKLSTTSSYVGDWRVATHRETVFQIRFGLNSENIGVNESLQTTYTTLVTPGNNTVVGGFGDLVPTLTLLTDLGITLVGGNTSTANYALAAAIQTRSADVRNQLYEVGAARGVRKVETTKFLGKSGFVNLDNVPVMRISEIYLSRAEAMATPGSPVFNEAAALADLNAIITNRGLTAVNLTGNQLYEEILRQRRIEFAFEGHRFFDLKRLGRNLVKGPHYSDVAFTDFRILPAIPQREVDSNPRIRQNFGY